MQITHSLRSEESSDSCHTGIHQQGHHTAPLDAKQAITSKITAQPGVLAEPNSRKITKFGSKRKRAAKLRTLEESRDLATLAMRLADDFVAIGSTTYNPSIAAAIRTTTKGWLKSRYWGQAMLLSDTYELPAPTSLPEWKRLPASVAQFFKLLSVLDLPDAVFLTIRLDPDVGDQAILSERGPSDWLADRINRAFTSIGITAAPMAFSIEFAPEQAKTLHKLHIHGAFCIPASLRRPAKAALKKALAPHYKQHGNNEAVKIEEPLSTQDVARYIPKDEATTQQQLVRLRGSKQGNRAHRSGTAATRGGQKKYAAIQQYLFGNPYSYAGLPDFS